MNEPKRSIKQQAIVLYTFGNKDQKVALLDSQYGKIMCYIPERSLSIGAHIEYQLIKKRRHSTAYMIEVIRMPFAVARSDILFLHHVLEVCYHFIPEGVVASDVFTLVEYMYRQNDTLIRSVSKKLYMSKLFILFGIYPEESYIRFNYWQMLLVESIESILEKSMDSAIEHELNVWLRSCIQVHPLVHTFKTLEFLNENEQ